MRRLLAGCVAAVVTALAGTGGVVQADEYRYWSYWRADGGSWTYATTGSASHRPDDGAVDGWRFTAGSERQAAQPRTAPDFDRICAGVRIKDGYKRVGLVVDYGTAADAPEGSEPPESEPVTRCVVVPEDATSADVLEEDSRTRIGTSGLLCAIDGYPESGCGDATGGGGSSASPSDGAAASGDSDRNTTTYVAIGVGAALAVLLVAAMAARRRIERGG